MKLNRTPNPLNRDARNKENENWDTIQQKFNNVVEEVSDAAFQKVIDGSKIDWEQMVDKVSDLPSNVETGETRGVKEDNKIYRFNGTDWIHIAEINLNPIAEVDQRLTTQLAETDNKLNTQPTKNKVLATLIWDDGNMKDYDLVFPYIESKNIKASFALYTNGIGSSNSLGESEIMEMKNAGHEFLSHSVSHPDLTTISKEEKEYELRESKRILEDLGLDIRGFVYPLNRYDEETLELVRKYYDYAFAKDRNIPNKPPINQYAMYRVTLEHEHDYVKQFIDRAIEEKSWLVFMAHGMYYDPEHVSYNPEAWANAKQNIEYCLSKGIEFVTTEQGINEFGNSITIGDYKESENMFILSKQGLVRSTNLMNIQYVDDIRDGYISADTRGSEFEKNTLTIATFLNVSNSGFPKSDAGILYTYIYGDGYGYGHQEWKPHQVEGTFERVWNSTSDTWGPWGHIKEVKESLNIIKDGINYVDVNTRPHEFPEGKVTAVQFLGTTGSGAGFPTESG